MPIKIALYALATLGALQVLRMTLRWCAWRFRESVRYALADRLWKESNRVSTALTEHGRELAQLRARMEELERAASHYSHR